MHLYVNVDWGLVFNHATEYNTIQMHDQCIRLGANSVENQLALKYQMIYCNLHLIYLCMVREYSIQIKMPVTYTVTIQCVVCLVLTCFQISLRTGSMLQTKVLHCPSMHGSSCAHRQSDHGINSQRFIHQKSVGSRGRSAPDPDEEAASAAPYPLAALVSFPA